MGAAGLGAGLDGAGGAGGEAVLLGKTVVLDAEPGPALWLLLVCLYITSKQCI